MTDVAAILNAHPRTSPGIDKDALVIAVQECLNCADMAIAVVGVLSRPTAYDRAVTEAVLRALIETCREGYQEHRKHAAENEACAICAEACRKCGQACRHLLGSLG